jgi:tRNA A37 threonylcarbamoyladenosine modification protein TsaB
MKLYIDSRDNKKIILKITEKGRELYGLEKDIVSKKQANELLLSIDNLLKDNNIDWFEIKEILVNNDGGSFTGLRLGVIVANTLAYAKNIKLSSSTKKSIEVNNIKIVKPDYDRDPDISVSKKKI